MRRWASHRTRSKVALLLLINLVTLLGGKYTVLMTILKIEFFGPSIAFAKVPKKKPPKPHLSRTQPESPVFQPTSRRAANLRQPQGGVRFGVHHIQWGETLSQIAQAHGTEVEILQHVNGIEDPDRLRAGEELLIPQGAREAGADWTSSLGPSDQALFLGVQRHLERRTSLHSKTRLAFTWPVDGTLTSPYGTREHVMGGGSPQFHAGIDLSVPTGTPVRAAQGGVVVFAGYNGAYGKAVKLDHLNGFSTLYAHNARVLVHVGQTVKAGQVICLSGSTGRSTGPHLHFEIHKDGSPVDPLQYLQ